MVFLGALDFEAGPKGAGGAIVLVAFDAFAAGREMLVEVALAEGGLLVASGKMPWTKSGVGFWVVRDFLEGRATS